MDRRDFLAGAAAAGAGAFLPGFGRARQILLRSSWQTVNIGDIAHTPGMLRLLETHLPQAEVTLWPGDLGGGVEAMIRRRFPRLRIARGGLDAAGKPATPELREAFERAHLFLHGSGPSVVAQAHLEAWRRVTGKPYGVYGVTLGEIDDPLRELLSGAAFVFCRDTDSLAHLRTRVEGPVLDFAPDATFAIDLKDEERALPFLKERGLEEGRFIAVVPRLRFTPYYKIRGRPPTAEDKRREAVSDEFKEADHAKLREVIAAWVRKTGGKALVCPEMTYQLEILDPLLVAPLPEEVRRDVVRRETYWGPDEAASVYARARAVVSFEMHSPIIAFAHGTPAIHVRQPTDTRKGRMWADVGLADWLFEVDAARGEDVARALLAIHADPAAAKEKLAKAAAFVTSRQKETMKAVAKAAGA